MSAERLGLSPACKQRGMSLIVVMIILVIASILGIAASQISLQGERGARNDRDLQMALQSANIGLQDANTEIFSASSSRAASFLPENDTAFVGSCGKGAGDLRRGLCPEQAPGVPPSWLTVDLTDDAAAVPYGTFTSNKLTLPSNSVVGIQPAHASRYVVERVYPHEQGANLQIEGGRQTAIDRAAWYRVTAMGYGPRDDIVAVTQSVIRKPAGYPNTP